MPQFRISGVAMKGISACVPKTVDDNKDFQYLEEKELSFLLKTIGVSTKRKVTGTTTCSDLCFESARSLLKGLNWNPKEVEMLIYVSQTRDYLLPNTAIILQDRLGLPQSAIAFDVPLGCSGYTYGISVIAGMMSASKIKKGLLLCGDTSTLTVSQTDKKTFPLFGDAGSATAFELDAEAADMIFNTGSDGSGYQAIIVPGGGSREPLEQREEDGGRVRLGYQKGRSNLHMDGAKIFEFSVKAVPESVSQLLHVSELTPEQIDFFVMHQANLIMNETIRKKLRFPPEKVPYSLQDFGNTSSASIPLTMVTQIREALQAGEKSLLLSGFGVGLSWASVLLNTNNLFVHELIEYED